MVCNPVCIASSRDELHLTSPVSREPLLVGFPHGLHGRHEPPMHLLHQLMHLGVIWTGRMVLRDINGLANYGVERDTLREQTKPGEETHTPKEGRCNACQPFDRLDSFLR